MSLVEYSEGNPIRKTIREQLGDEVVRSRGWIAVVLSTCVIATPLLFIAAQIVFDFVLIEVGIGDIPFFPDVLAHVVAQAGVILVFVVGRLAYFALQYPDALRSGACPRGRGLLRLDWMDFGILVLLFPTFFRSFNGVVISLFVVVILTILLQSIGFDIFTMPVYLAVLGVFLVGLHLIPGTIIDTTLINRFEGYLKHPPEALFVVSAVAVLFDLSMVNTDRYTWEYGEAYFPERDSVVAVAVSAALGASVYFASKELLLAVAAL